MKDIGHHKNKLQKKMFREAKKRALTQQGKKEEKISEVDFEIQENFEEFHKKKEVPVIRVHKKRFH